MIDPIACLDFMRDNSAKLAQAKADRIYIEESLRVVKAIQMKQHPGLSVAAQEREALASDEYRIALEGLKAAVFAEESLRHLMTTASAKVEVWRSMESSNRALDRGAR